ncbi:MAG TPA: Wzt carbohydrate-binding domain-containing protein, partial [Dysgonamonadaceae bacterium]|nr:Wzt carbohydrate-binding domain-containing protein [Dysgonamonadaceae bacterium]
MTVRLGFAIAAHLEPEILVVDEVLAVGDAEFQKKAIGKMQDVSTNDGRTVLFVSHNMASVKSLCTAAILIDNGQVKNSGNTEKIVEQYLIDNNQVEEFNGFRELRNRPNTLSSAPIIEFLKLKDKLGNTTNIINAGEPIIIELGIKKEFQIKGNTGIGIYFYRQGEKVAGITSFMGTPLLNKNKNNIVILKTEPLRLIPNTYQIELVVAQKSVKRLDQIYDAATITV